MEIIFKIRQPRLVGENSGLPEAVVSSINSKLILNEFQNLGKFYTTLSIIFPNILKFHCK